MDLNLFLIIVNTIQAIDYIIKGIVKLHHFLKKHIDIILKGIYHAITEKIIKVTLLSISIFFLSVSSFGFFITFLKYDVLSSMFFLKINAIFLFTVLSQGFIYYQKNTYSKDRLEYLQA